MANLFEPGEIVYIKKLPNIKLIVRRYENKAYLCKVFNHPGNRVISFDEDDLVASANPTEKRYR